MINTIEECSVRAFMRAMFNKDYSGLNGGGEAELSKIYVEYIDISGIGETREYEVLKEINNIQIRMTYIKGMVELQRKIIGLFGAPSIQVQEDLAKKGYRIKWNEATPEAYLKDLDSIEIREKRYVAEMDILIKELKELRNGSPVINTNARLDFIRNLNELGRHNYKIDKDATMMDELALMIKDFREAAQEQIMKSQLKQTF